jgi:hypothetical protein
MFRDFFSHKRRTHCAKSSFDSWDTPSILMPPGNSHTVGIVEIISIRRRCCVASTDQKTAKLLSAYLHTITAGRTLLQYYSHALRVFLSQTPNLDHFTRYEVLPFSNAFSRIYCIRNSTAPKCWPTCTKWRMLYAEHKLEAGRLQREWIEWSLCSISSQWM